LQRSAVGEKSKLMENPNFLDSKSSSKTGNIPSDMDIAIGQMDRRLVKRYQANKKNKLSEI